MNIKQRKIKIKPRIKLNYTIYITPNLINSFNTISDASVIQPM